MKKVHYSGFKVEHRKSGPGLIIRAVTAYGPETTMGGVFQTEAAAKRWIKAEGEAWLVKLNDRPLKA